MAVAYEPAVFDKLPMLGDAGEAFDGKNGDAMVDEFRRLFIHYGLDRVFGLVLNHRHFMMNANERLVEYNGTSVPWTTLLEKTEPSTWLLSDKEECFPYEFSYSPKPGAQVDIKSPADPEYAEFVKAFVAVLRRNEADGLFGLCKYPGDDFEGRVEITAGRANINLHPKDAPADVPARPAAWFFSPTLHGNCVCVCGGNGHTTRTHRGHVASR